MTQVKVLLVDDDPLSRRMVSAKIKPLGAVVVEAADGVEAFELLKSHDIDVVILDLEMPRMNGYDLLGCIRCVSKFKHLPVVVLTGKEDRASLERALICGATSFLVKPLNWLAFGAHIAHLLAVARVMRRISSHKAGDPVMSTGDTIECYAD